MAKNNTSVAEIANKQRHLYLLSKVQQNKKLTRSEINDLERYEMAKNTKKTKKAKITTKLTNKQLAFCREYLVDRNATQAAIRAGYATKGAEVTGSQLLRNPKVQSKLTELEKPITEKLEITAEKVLQELANIAFFDPAELYDEKGNLRDIHNIPAPTRRVIASLDVTEEFTNGIKTGTVKKVRLNSKIKALELLGKTNTLNLFSETINHKVTDGCGVLVVPATVDKTQWQKQATENQNQDGKANGK